MQTRAGPAIFRGTTGFWGRKEACIDYKRIATMSRTARHRRQDPGDTQVFCIVASVERSGKEEGLSTSMCLAR